jgi:hypothetical protein
MLKHTVNKVQSLRDFSDDKNLNSKSLRDLPVVSGILNSQFSIGYAELRFSIHLSSLPIKQFTGPNNPEGCSR